MTLRNPVVGSRRVTSATDIAHSRYHHKIIIAFAVLVILTGIVSRAAYGVYKRAELVRTQTDPVALDDWKRAHPDNDPVTGRLLASDSASAESFARTDGASVRTAAAVKRTDALTEDKPGAAEFNAALAFRKELKIDDALAAFEAALALTKDERFSAVLAESRKTETYKKILSIFDETPVPHAVALSAAGKEPVFVRFIFRNRRAIGLVDGEYRPDQVNVQLILADRPDLPQTQLIPLKQAEIPFELFPADDVRALFENAFRQTGGSSAADRSISALYDSVVLGLRLNLKSDIDALLADAINQRPQLVDELQREVIVRGMDDVITFQMRNEPEKADKKLASLKTLFPTNRELQKTIAETDDMLKMMRAGGYRSTIRFTDVASAPAKTPAPAETPKPEQPAIIPAQTQVPPPSQPSPDSDPADDTGQRPEIRALGIMDRTPGQPAEMPMDDEPSGNGPAIAPLPTSGLPVAAEEDEPELESEPEEMQAEPFLDENASAKRKDLVERAQVHFDRGLAEYQKWKNDWGNPNKYL